MDSGNSGSFQSSSGGDEEYDSRATDSISSFFNPTPTPTASLTNLTPPTLSSPIFDTLPYLDSNPNPLPNLPWTPTLLPPWPPSNLNCTHINPLPHPHPAPDKPPNTAPKSTKKRSRASRRAPTTVLTTDTSNFRAMVQEFTGIPASPFSASSPFARSGFDFFHTPSPYLLRPFAQKGQPPSFSNSNSSYTTTATTTCSNANSNIMTNNPIVSFQSLLQSTLAPKYSLPTMQALPTEANYGELSTIVASEAMQSRKRNHEGELAGWAQLSQQGANYGNSQQVSSCKVNYSVPESSEKGSETPPVRGEGMLESWNRSSE